MHFKGIYYKLDDNVAKSKFSELLINIYKDEWIVTVNDFVNSICKKRHSC